jgi:hypothetical protein
MRFFWKDFSYSLSCGVLIAALSVMFYSWGGEILAVPGILIEGWINLIIVSASDDPYFSLRKTWPLFEGLCYFVFFFILVRSFRFFRST